MANRQFDMPMPNGERFVAEVVKDQQDVVQIRVETATHDWRLPTADEWRDARRHVMGFLDSVFKAEEEPSAVPLTSDEFKNSAVAKSNEASWKDAT